jgi:hypothetical protein
VKTYESISGIWPYPNELSNQRARRPSRTCEAIVSTLWQFHILDIGTNVQARFFILLGIGAITFSSIFSEQPLDPSTC